MSRLPAVGRAWAPRFAGVALVVTVAGTVASCASYTENTSDMRRAYRSGGYEEALKSLADAGVEESGKDRLLYHLERAMIKDRAGDRKDSRRHLMDADRVVDELYTTSVSRVAASFVVNDAASDYEGEDYEQVAIHTMLALSFLEDGDLDGAAVEARRINSKLAEINAKYGDQRKNRYAEDVFARYLSAAIHEATGNIDSAIIDYRKALALYRGGDGDDVVYVGQPPGGLVRALWRLLNARGRGDEARRLAETYPRETSAEKAAPKGTGEVIVFHEVGSIAVKEHDDFVIGIAGQIVRFSWPVIPSRHSTVHGFTGVEASSPRLREDADTVQDLNRVARATLEDKRLRMIAKEGARLLAKGQLVRYADEHFGPLAGLAANIYAAVTETADTRGWTTLPERFLATRARLPVGKHTLAIHNNGKLTRMAEVDVREGRLVLLRDNGGGLTKASVRAPAG